MGFELPGSHLAIKEKIERLERSGKTTKFAQLTRYSYDIDVVDERREILEYVLK